MFQIKAFEIQDTHTCLFAPVTLTLNWWPML